MAVNVSDIIKIVEEIAPLNLAEKWDNSGLQTGQADWPVKKIVTALDPLPEVVEYACSVDADLLITHHPLIFKPLSKVDFSSTSGKIIRMSLENRLAIYSTHTNYDSAVDGLNSVLADKIGLVNQLVLSPGAVEKKCKIVIFVPKEHKDGVLDALYDSPAGKIDNYSCCTFRSDGVGTYKPNEKASPYEGNINELSSADELKIEAVVNEKDVQKVIARVKKKHPYESMAHDIIPLLNSDSNTGLGKVGELRDPMPLGKLAEVIKERLDLNYIKIAGDRDMIVNKVALCSGSGSGLLKNFYKSGAEVYLSGDLSYHDARTIEENRLGLLDVGHFASEIIVAEALKKQLQDSCVKNGYDLEIFASPVEKDPFYIL